MKFVLSAVSKYCVWWHSSATFFWTQHSRYENALCPKPLTSGYTSKRENGYTGNASVGQIWDASNDILQTGLHIFLGLQLQFSLFVSCFVCFLFCVFSVSCIFCFVYFLYRVFPASCISCILHFLVHIFSVLCIFCLMYAIMCPFSLAASFVYHHWRERETLSW